MKRAKVLVNPNAVDVDRYSPDIDGSHVRRRLGIDDDLVIGFIGTFGPWHGAENLAIAFDRLLDQRADLAARARLLMIGAGDRLPATKRVVANGHHQERVTFTGGVPPGRRTSVSRRL